MAQNKGRRAGAWVIMILLFIGLVGFGGANLSGGARSIGTAGDKDILVSDYANALRGQLDAFSAQIGQPLSFVQAQAIGLDQSVLSQVVAERVLDSEAASLGLSVGDARVAERVRALPQFAGLSGDFDRESYAFTLERNGLSEAEFEQGLREEMARSLLQAAVISGIGAPDIYAETLTKFIGERRDFSWASVTDVVLDGPIPDPSEADVQAHYDTNPDLYTRPEVRIATYAAVTPEDIQGEVTVDESAIEELYQSRIDTFVQPERRLVERLVFSGTEAADAALAAITAEETDFDTLVSDRGLDLADVDLGDVDQPSLGDAGDAVFAAQPGDIVGPFDTALGPALFRMNAVLSAQEITFDEARDDLRAELAQDRARRVIDGERSQIEDLLAGGASPEDLAERTALALGTLEWEVGSTDGLAAYNEVRTALGAAEVNAFPEITELPDGGLVVLRLDEVVAPEVRPLDDVRAQVIVDRIATARTEALEAAAEAIAADVAAGAAFADTGLAAFAEVDMIRRDFIAGAPQGLMAEVFDMAEGEARMVRDDAGLIAVVRLDAIKDADMDSETMTAERDAIAARAGQSIAQDIYGAYSGAVRNRTEVTLDQGVITAVHNAFQ